MAHLPANPLHWTVPQVLIWAQQHGLDPDVVEHLEAHQIDGPTLVYLNSEALAQLGSRYTGIWNHHQEKLLSLIEHLPHENIEYGTSNVSLIDAAPDTRNLLHSGFVTKLGSKRKSWKKRHLRLFDDGLLTYAKASDENATILGEIRLAQVQSIRTDMDTDWKNLGTECPMEAIPELRIEIVSEKRTLRFYTSTKVEAQKWVKYLCDAKEAADSRIILGKSNLSDRRSRFMQHELLKRLMVPVLKGWLFKSSEKNKKWTRRFFLLTDGWVLHYWKDERCLGAPLGTIKLKYCQKMTHGSHCKWKFAVPSVAKTDQRFQISTDARTYHFYAFDKVEASAWITAISASLAKAQVSPTDETTTENVDAELEPIADPITYDVDVDEDEDEEDFQASIMSSDDEDIEEFNNEKESAYFVDRYLDMYNLPHTKLRRRMLLEALKIGRSGNPTSKRRHVYIIYNPVSGSGLAKKNVDYTVVPVLEVAGVDFKVVATTHRGFAREFARTLSYSQSHGIIVAGGDGMVSEVMSGLMERTDGCVESGFTVGIIPSGTANAMAHELDLYESKSYIELISSMSLMVARGITRRVDVISMESKASKTVCGLSCVGWGLAGAVAKKADQLRWLPGQRKFRYDIAGFVTLMKNWPLNCEAEFEFLAQESSSNGDPHFVWKKEKINMLNMIASSCSKLGVDNPICPKAKIDDGMLSMVFMGGKHSRKDAALAGRSMKIGNFLAEHKSMTMHRVREFKMTPTSDSDVPLLIDGDPWGLDEVHVKVLHKAITVFCKPPISSSN